MKAFYPFLNKILMFSFVFFIISCNNTKKDTSILETKSVDLSEVTIENELLLKEDLSKKSNLNPILVAIKHSHFPDLIKQKKDYALSGPVKNFERYYLYDSERLEELNYGSIQVAKEDRKEKLSFDKNGFLLESERGESKVIYEYGQNNIPLKQKILNNGKEFMRIFNYDPLGRIKSLTDANQEYIMEWSYERENELPIDIRLYNGEEIEYRDILSWNDGKIIKKEMIWYNYISRNGIGGRSYEEYEYYKDGSYMLKYEKHNDWGRFIRWKSYYDHSNNLTANYSINYKGENYSESSLKYDTSGNLIESSERSNLKSLDIPFGGSISDTYSIDVTLPLKLIDLTTNQYDQHNNIVKSNGPPLFRDYDEDFTYVPAVENIITIFKYKYDKFGNWIEKVKITDGLISSYEKRILTYY